MDKYDALKIENQLCFPLYACSKEMIKRYKRLLEEIDLTYTQYIAMIALWEKKSLNVKELGSILYLDSGTLSPLLKKLEKKGFVYHLQRHVTASPKRAYAQRMCYRLNTLGILTVKDMLACNEEVA